MQDASDAVPVVVRPAGTLTCLDDTPVTGEGVPEGVGREGQGQRQSGALHCYSCPSPSVLYKHHSRSFPAVEWRGAFVLAVLPAIFTILSFAPTPSPTIVHLKSLL